MAAPRYRAFLGATTGRVSGVDVFSAHLVRGLRARGVAAEILLTEPHGPTADPMPFPDDVPVTRLGARGEWWSRWRAMIAFLEARAPCVWLPNYDWFYSCVSPRLSDRVAVVGIVHSDDPQHYEHVSRLGSYWNAVVCVSEAVREETAALVPELGARIERVPYGVPVPERLVARRAASGAPLRIAYAGRLLEHQKRCLDLARVARELERRGVPFELAIAGDGDDGPALRDACAALALRGKVRFLGTLPNDAVLRLFEESDALLLPSAFEGLPVSLLEAMARGCVPVVADSRSGIPELVEDARSGWRVPVGATSAFVDRLEALQRDPALRASLSHGAFESVRRGGFDVETMVDAYAALFERVLRDAAEGRFRRARGAIRPPAALERELSWRRRVPAPLRRGFRFARRVRAALGRRARRWLGGARGVA